MSNVGVQVVDRGSVSRLIEDARRDLQEVYVLTTGDDADRNAFFKAVRSTFPLNPPVPSARSWEALSDSLWEGLSNTRGDDIVIIWTDAERFRQAAPDDFSVALDIFKDLTVGLGDRTMTLDHPKNLSVFVALDEAEG
jgi:hypothetical protein